MADDFLHELAEQAGIETGKAPKNKPVVISKPKFEVDPAGRFVCNWPSDGVRMVAEAPERKRLEFWILLSVHMQTDDAMPRALITKKRLNLRSASGSAEIVRLLKGQVERDWGGRLEMLSNLVDENYSAGEPMVWLDEVADPGPISYFANPLLEKNEHNILAGRGGSTKSFLALAMCIAHATGRQVVPGITVNGTGRALYLDWEANAVALRRRLSQFGATHKNIAYKRMQAPLADVGDEIEQLIRAENFGLVVIDSASMASGGEIIDEASVARFFLTCRSFKSTILTLAHLSKDHEAEDPIGSVYWLNQARVVWRILKDQIEGDSTVRLDLTQRKSNNDQIHRPFSLEMNFGGQTIAYRLMDAGAADETKLPLATRISRFLTDNGKKTAAEIAEALGKPINHVSNTLKNGEAKLFGHDGAKRDRLWWALDLHSVNKGSSHVNSGYSHAPGVPTGHTDGASSYSPTNQPKEQKGEEGDEPW